MCWRGGRYVLNAKEKAFVSVYEIYNVEKKNRRRYSLVIYNELRILLKKKKTKEKSSFFKTNLISELFHTRRTRGLNNI